MRDQLHKGWRCERAWVLGEVRDAERGTWEFARHWEEKELELGGLIRSGPGPGRGEGSPS